MEHEKVAEAQPVKPASSAPDGSQQAAVSDALTEVAENVVYSVFPSMDSACAIRYIQQTRRMLAGHFATLTAQLTHQEQQHTVCAVCMNDKHTPLRRDEMGGYVCLTCIDRQLDLLQAQLQQATARAEQAERELGQARNAALGEAAQAVPASWLDPLLSGPGRVVSKSPRPEIETLLAALASRIRALKTEEGAR